MKLNDHPVGVSRDAVPLSGHLFMRMLEKISVGRVHLVQPDGLVRTFGERAEKLLPVDHDVQLEIFDWRATGLILRQGDVGFAESLRRGWLGCEDLVSLFTIAMLNQQVSQAVHGQWWALLLKRLSHWVFKDNSRSGSRRNILSHYDVGNDFYRIWLDPSMTYSSAYFAGDTSLDLEQAQNQKYDLILDQLGATPGQTVLEIGCGWAGFAERAARRGLNVVGITISDAQLKYGRARIAEAGLNDLVELRLQDYRDVKEQFDHIVSIEMFEAVGLLHWPSYFKVVARCLRHGGKAVIQAIDIAEDRFDAYRHGTDFIQQYIFPGGMLPSATRFARETHSAGLKVDDTVSFGFDYAETLRLWGVAFYRNLNAISAQGFDDAFIRIWKMYLAYCEVGFRYARTDVKQWVLSHA
jgi:cyclopropane-fatty-acyl-phospholipid synthase